MLGAQQQLHRLTSVSRQRNVLGTALFSLSLAPGVGRESCLPPGGVCGSREQFGCGRSRGAFPALPSSPRSEGWRDRSSSAPWEAVAHPHGEQVWSSWVDMQSQSWRELHSSGAGKPQLTLRSMTVALIPAGLKLLLQNESIQAPACPNAAMQAKGRIQHTWLCPGQGSCCWTMLKLVCVPGLTPSSANPSLCPSVPVGHVPARDRHPMGAIGVRRWVHGPCQCLVTSMSIVLPLSSATATLAAAPIPVGTCPAFPPVHGPGEPGQQHSTSLCPVG